MTQAPEILYKAVLRLPDDERSEFLRLLNEYLHEDAQRRKTILFEARESRPSLMSGPVGQRCPVCGR